jgi:hypothetical protein
VTCDGSGTLSRVRLSGNGSKIIEVATLAVQCPGCVACDPGRVVDVEDTVTADFDDMDQRKGSVIALLLCAFALAVALGLLWWCVATAYNAWRMIHV